VVRDSRAVTVSITGTASVLAPIGDGRNDAELLAPVVEAAMTAGDVGRPDIGIVCSASSEFLNGVVGTVMGAFDAFPGWPPRTHAHLDGDGAFALYEAWIRLLAGEAENALVCAVSRPLADDPRRVLDLQLDPYYLVPLAPRPEDLAGLQAAGPFSSSTICAGAAAVVLSVNRPGVRISGIEQRFDTHALGARDLRSSPSITAASAALGLPGSTLDVLEVHASFSHQEQIVVEAIGARHVGALNPSGGALAADPIMVTGLVRVIEAANAIARREAARAVAHATNGPCLQHNLLCLLELS
jgi:Thiolase, C-terminal domain